MKEFKAVILGPGGVGKSALTVQFISGKFVERYDPTVEDFYRKEIEVDGDPAILEILDTAGTEQFASMRDLYIKNGQGFVIVYSLTSRQSFQDIKLIREQILRVKGNNRVPIVLAANKCDLATSALREVATEEGIMLANEWNVPYVETSAKNSAVVNSLFTEIVKEMNLKSLQQFGYGNYKDKKKQKKNKTKKKPPPKHSSVPKQSNTNTNTTLFSTNSESYASSLKDSAMMNSSSNVCLKKASGGSSPAAAAAAKKAAASWSSCLNYSSCCCCYFRRRSNINYVKSKCSSNDTASMRPTLPPPSAILSNQNFVDDTKKLKQKNDNSSSRRLCTIL